MIRTLLLLTLSVILFGSGTYTGWRAARFLDPVLDARDNLAIRKLGGLLYERPQ